MVLLDHFHPPLSVRRHWHAFHNAWATYIASALNQQLPQGYFAEPNVQYGIEIDVAAFEEGIQSEATRAVILPIQKNEWQPPAPSQTLSFQPTTEAVEISIFNSEAGPTLAGAIELVSPANKDRASHRDAFVSKCQTYLQQGIGLMIVDVVTSRNANLHEELLARLGTTSTQRSAGGGSGGYAKEQAQSSSPNLSAIAYRVVKRAEQPNLDVWQEILSPGYSLPTLPLWLRGELCLPVDLDATYQRTCREQRISLNSA